MWSDYIHTDYWDVTHPNYTQTHMHILVYYVYFHLWNLWKRNMRSFISCTSEVLDLDLSSPVNVTRILYVFDRDEQWKLRPEREDSVVLLRSSGLSGTPQPWAAHQTLAGAGTVTPTTNIKATWRPLHCRDIHMCVTGQVSRGGVEREHHRALPERAGCDGQQQLPRQLWSRGEGRQSGIQSCGKTTLQVPVWYQLNYIPSS